MKGFFRLLTTTQVRQILRSFPRLPGEEVPLNKALGRAVANDIVSPEDLPPFSRSTMDGYALRARDIFGASETEPALLKVVGEVRMGQAPGCGPIGPGEAVRIWTGGMVPEGADAVVMVEYTKELDKDLIEVYKAAAPNENMILKGEDCQKDKVCITRGKRLRPQDLGLLAGLGITKVKVVKSPRVFIISTGDEIVPETEVPEDGKVRDINSTTLEALVRQGKATVKRLGIVEDSFDSIYEKCREALDMGADVILVSGGSSVGARDFTLKVFEHLSGEPPLVHGVAVRPGKPTIISRFEDTALLGLPGHAASCMVVYMLFVQYLLNVMLGLDPETDMEFKRAVCGQIFPSVTGREDYVRVRLEDSKDGILPVAMPIYGKSGLISTLVKADGLLKIPRDSEGYHEGEEAEVMLLP